MIFKMQVRLDYRSRRGLALGLEPDIRYGQNKTSWARLRTYFLRDSNPNLNRTSEMREGVPKDRYRVSVQDRTNFAEDVYGIANITKLSDEFLLQDFYQSEFQLDPQPDNVVAVTKMNPIYTLTAITRFQANDFFEATTRLPEVVLDVKRTPLFGGPIFYEGETGLANLRRQFAADSGFQNYGTLRLDSFHQFLYPNTYFGWLSVVPRAGFRATYYDETRDLGKRSSLRGCNPVHSRLSCRIRPCESQSKTEAAVSRGQSSTRASNAPSRSRANGKCAKPERLGLDGLRHVIQPFTNFSWVSSSELESRFDLAVRSVSTFHSVAAHRLPAIHHHRFDR